MVVHFEMSLDRTVGPRLTYTVARARAHLLSFPKTLRD